MIITSHMQKNIQIYPCLLKLSHKQESVTDGQTAAITISPHRYRGWDNYTIGWFIVLNATFNNISVISCRSILLVEETRILEENHRPVASHWQTKNKISHNVVWSTSRHEQGLKSTLLVIGTDCSGNCKSN